MKACTRRGPPGVVLRTLILGRSKRTPTWEFAIPPGILGGYPGEDTPEYPSSLGYPLPWEACGRLGQNYHRGVDMGSLRA